MENIQEEFFIPLGKVIANPLVEPVLWGVLSVILILWGVMSVILRYHWKNYSFDQRKILLPKRIYFTGSFLFLCAMITSLIFYSL